MSAKKRHTRNRRKRRATRAVMAHGVTAKPRHTAKSGRTGGIHTRKLKSLERTGRRGSARVVSAMTVPVRSRKPEPLIFASASEAIAATKRARRTKEARGGA